MITKLMNILKIKSPRVDLVLHPRSNEKHGTISGEFQLYGGWRTQKVNRLECDLVKVFPGKKPEFVEPVTTVLMARIIDANGCSEFPFQYQLPEDLPVLENGGTYKLQTKLVFENNAKCFDHDDLIVS